MGKYQTTEMGCRMKPFPELYYFIAIVTAVIVFSLITLVAVNCGADEIDMSIIAQIESSNNPDAYNVLSKATGLYGITPVCLLDFNNYHKRKYSISEMFMPKKGYSVAFWYMNVRIPQLLKHYKIYHTSVKELDLLKIICYNWGIGNCIKWNKQGKNFNSLPKETRRYYESYVKTKSNKF